jgi:hypothetical protein
LVIDVARQNVPNARFSIRLAAEKAVQSCSPTNKRAQRRMRFEIHGRASCNA